MKQLIRILSVVLCFSLTSTVSQAFFSSEKNDVECTELRKAVLSADKSMNEANDLVMHALVRRIDLTAEEQSDKKDAIEGAYKDVSWLKKSLDLKESEMLLNHAPITDEDMEYLDMEISLVKAHISTSHPECLRYLKDPNRYWGQ